MKLKKDIFPKRVRQLHWTVNSVKHKGPCYMARRKHRKPNTYQEPGPWDHQDVPIYRYQHEYDRQKRGI